MSDVALDDNHDLDITDAELRLVTDVDSPEAIAQEQRIALQFHRGEWFLNTLVGIPYLTQVFVKNPSLAALNVLFTRAILSVPGTVELKELALNFDDDQRPLRVLKIDYDSRAAEGVPIDTGQLAVVL